MKKIIRKFKADIVIGTGGYVCAPAVAAANAMKIPTLIHEQNVYPGSAIRFSCEKNTTVTAISFDESRKYLSGAKNVVLTGNPVRESIVNADREKARAELNIGNEKNWFLVVGGSLGAMKINDVLCDYLKSTKKENVKFVISTGKRDFDRVKENLNGAKK
ncbi:MAG: UDP-N-acetylglucosamine--N-acetylmuramyl-(pentapeptide) pyrophosphoryl-undecaprenol N-acetylglucosamine transferase [Clostridiales bacterium]|nr:MAG: UDP-N-acetylglucosamine--N-acetylmuramyl-(pentapeptide) pyrophosphoryl-undecaprenol N-acetylglucosamine transferase [Clostridiales bacterium]